MRDIRRDIDDEIRFHVDARTEELVRLGVPEPEARRRALAEYGDVDQSRRELAVVDQRRHERSARNRRRFDLFSDLRHAARSLARRPVLLLVVTLTLGLGIAANAVMFGVVDQLLLRPPAHVADAGRVRRVYFRDVSDGVARLGETTTYLTLPALRAGAPAFSDVSVARRPVGYSLGRGAEAQSVQVQLVSGSWFRLLGVRPHLGRVFTDEDDRIPEGAPVALVSYGFWRQHFGNDTGAIGRELLLQGKRFTVVGVAPRGFAGIDRQKVDVWLPVSSFAREEIGDGWHNTTDNWWAQVIGRIRPGLSDEVATAEATAAYRALVRGWKDERRDSTSSIVLASIIEARTPDGLSREGKVSLWLMGVSGIVLLIACANVANLLLVRTLERRREIAVRMAMGVSRGRLVGMLLTEAALLAVAGAVVALGFALLGSRLIQDILLPSVVWRESVVDARVFGFTLGITVLCVLLAGLAPALQGLSTRVAEDLKASSRQLAGGRGRLRFGLMLVQAALSVVLLIGAGLLVKSLRHVASRELGIDRERVLRVSMPLSRFGFDAPRIEEIYRRGTEQLRTLPGVAGVGVARMTVPMSSASASNFEVPGVEPPPMPRGGPYNSAVTSGFFATIGATMVQGRDFTDAEERTPARVLVVNEAVAKAYWANASPIGQCAIFGSDSVCSTVIGVVRTVLQFNLINDDRAIVYAPPSHPGVDGAPPGAMLIRVAGEPATVIPAIRRTLQGLSPSMPFVTVRPYSELVAPQLQPWRLGATMFTLFGGIALVIAAVGLYSVMAYWVSQRRHEIGVRMALGAQRSHVVRLVALQSSRAVAAGLLLGAAGALIASRWIGDLLYETSPREPMVYAGAALVLALASVVASVVPVRRSTAVDPAQTIRAE